MLRHNRLRLLLNKERPTLFEAASFQILSMNEIAEYKFVVADDGLKQEVVELLQQNNLPVTDLDDGKILFALLQKDKIVGTGGLELFNQCALIRSITVETGSRGKGLGKLISRELEKICRERGIDWVYLLTTTAKDFFINQGYRVISREDVPLPIKTTSEFSSVCPSSAIVMEKSLA